MLRLIALAVCFAVLSGAQCAPVGDPLPIVKCSTRHWAPLIGAGFDLPPGYALLSPLASETFESWGSGGRDGSVINLYRSPASGTLEEMGADLAAFYAENGIILASHKDVTMYGQECWIVAVLYDDGSSLVQVIIALHETRYSLGVTGTPSSGMALISDQEAAARTLCVE